MKKRKVALGVTVAIAVAIGAGVFAKNASSKKAGTPNLGEEKVSVEQIPEVLWDCDASFDEKPRNFRLKMAPGRGVFYNPDPDDLHSYFSGWFTIRGRKFHFDFLALVDTKHGSQVVGHPGHHDYTWDGVLKKLDNGELKFDATESYNYEGRPLLTKISATCKALNPPAQSAENREATAPVPPLQKAPAAITPALVTPGVPAENTSVEQVGAAAPTSSSPHGADRGQALYSDNCQKCHATGVLGAPMFGDKEGWAKRLQQPIETLYANAINGKGAMLPKGGSGATDGDIKAAVDYMIAAAK